MLPLAGPTIPDSADAFAVALRTGLTAHNLGCKAVTASGAWPVLDSLHVDLTGVQLTRSQRFTAAGDAKVGDFTVARFELSAVPALIESAPVHISLRAEGVGFSLNRDAESSLWVKMSRATCGDITVEITRLDLERLVHSLATEAAKEHGVEIKRTSVSLNSRGPRAVSFAAEVTAKMFIATAAVKISGDLELDDHLEARLSNLQFHGEGMVANLAGAVIRPQLSKLEGRTFQLMNMALGEITLRNVEMAAGDPLRLSAEFGS